MKNFLFLIFALNVLAFGLMGQSTAVTQTFNTSSYGDVKSWSGTGFALNNGYLVTNWHVAEDARTIYV